jgi:hypothetical protein
MASEMIEKFWALVERGDAAACWPWLGRKQRGRPGALYGYFGHGTRAHRFSWELANGRAVPEGLVVRHKCDNPICVNPAHLEIGTQKQNVQDRYDRHRDRHLAGEQHARSKLTDEKVRRLREMLASGVSTRAAAREMGVSQFGVRYAAKHGWRHV